MDTRLQRGFTLIEMLVAIAVAAILLGIGIPSFSGAIKNARVSADNNELTQALYLARSEAVKSSTEVTVCPRASENAMTCGSGMFDWRHGWLVFIDNEFATNELAATVGPLDEIIGIHPKQRSNNVISAIGSTDRTVNTVTGRNYIRYETTGISEWANGSFLICDDATHERSRVINIAPTGDVRPGRKSGSEYLRDVFNREACTP